MPYLTGQYGEQEERVENDYCSGDILCFLLKGNLHAWQPTHSRTYAHHSPAGCTVHPIKHNTWSERHNSKETPTHHTTHPHTHTYACTPSYPIQSFSVVSTNCTPAPSPFCTIYSKYTAHGGWPENGDNKERGQNTSQWTLLPLQSLRRSWLQPLQLPVDTKSIAIDLPPSTVG